MALPQIQIGDGMLGEALLASVDIVQELNQHWWCTIVCRNTEDQRIPVEELLGKPVEVKTTDDQGSTTVHFSGTVHDVEVEYEVWGSYTATLIAVSNSFGMDVTAHKQYYLAKTLSSVASTIGGRHGLTVSVSAAASRSTARSPSADRVQAPRPAGESGLFGLALRPPRHAVGHLHQPGKGTAILLRRRKSDRCGTEGIAAVAAGV